MGILNALKTYKDRMDSEKSSMRLWVINTFKKVDESKINPQLKNWCKLSITVSTSVYEFLIDNFRDSFKGVKADNGLKEIVSYFLFHTLTIYHDSFMENIESNSASETIKEISSIFEFNEETYIRFESYMSTYKERNVSLEARSLLFAIISETNPPMKEFPNNLEKEFIHNVLMKNIAFNNLLEKQGFTAN